MDLGGSHVISALTAATLSGIAYGESRTDVSTALTAVPPAQQGPWTLLWFANDSANQAFAAASADGSLAVAIRGTVTDPRSEAFWLDWFKQDGGALEQQVWPWPGAPAGAYVAQGTLIGMCSLLSLTDSGSSLLALLKQHGGSGWVTITGHSLGGGLAATLAPWLQQQLSETGLRFQPITFAAPAIGNAIFAQWLEDSFSSAQHRYHNTLDVVPHAWAFPLASTARPRTTSVPHPQTPRTFTAPPPRNVE